MVPNSSLLQYLQGTNIQRFLNDTRVILYFNGDRKENIRCLIIKWNVFSFWYNFFLQNNLDRNTYIFTIIRKLPANCGLFLVKHLMIFCCNRVVPLLTTVIVCLQTTVLVGERRDWVAANTTRFNVTWYFLLRFLEKSCLYK